MVKVAAALGTFRQRSVHECALIILYEKGTGV